MRLIKGNIERIVESEQAAEALKKQGFKEIEQAAEPEDCASLESLKVDDLRKLAKEQGLEHVDRLKREELLDLLTEEG